MNEEQDTRQEVLDLIYHNIINKGHKQTWESIENISRPEGRLYFRRLFIHLQGQIPERKLFKEYIEVRGNETVKIFKI